MKKSFKDFQEDLLREYSKKFLKKTLKKSPGKFLEEKRNFHKETLVEHFLKKIMEDSLKIERNP